jgi:F-type H+-transporting ATPase subunit gamma
VSGTYDEIMIAYTRFINNVTFEPTLLRLFPILKDPEVAQNPMHGRVEFLPDANTVLEKSISLYINTIVYGTIMESQISEQASRRNAMENATNNSEELINKLQLQYNRERQAAITQELTEIVNGANALKKGN